MPALGGTVSVNLGSASTFGLLGSTITDTGVSNIAGDVGATTTVTINSPWVVTGTIYPAGDAVAMAAYGAFESAYNTALALGATQPTLTSLPATQTFIGNNVYTFTNGISTTTGTALTFDAQNTPADVFVIQIEGAFTVNGILSFNLINGAQANNIFWIVDGAATISVDSSPAQTFDGSILSGTSFTMSSASGGSGTLAGTINGCAFSETANTLAGATDVTGCVGGGAGPVAGDSSVPEPGTLTLLGLGFGAGCLLLRKFRSIR